MITPNGLHLGARKSAQDPRDHDIRAKALLPVALPPHVDLRDRLPPPWDQGPLGSCEAHGVGRALAAMYPGFMPSRLALYYAARALEGQAAQDSGVQTRDMLKAVARGAIPEDAWPYEVSRFAQAPPAMDPVFRAGSYSALTDRGALLGWLALGNPVPFAIDLPASFDDWPPGGVISIDGRPSVGWHCLCAVGYDLPANSIIFTNSWGEAWGDGGHGVIPIDYVLGPSGSDAWALHTIPDAQVPPGPSFGGVPIQGEKQE